MSDEVIVVSGSVDATIYGKGDTCLMINPFDTYHLFRLWDSWNSSERKLMNLSSSSQKLYLVFKSNNSEIRINEFSNSGSNYNVDKSSGEVLFKITKENAKSILALSTNTFYVTRKIIKEDESGNIIYTSGEEVLFIGKWADESKWSSSSLSSTITSLQTQLASANSQITSLTNENNEYKLQIESLTTANENLQLQVDSLQSQVEDLQDQLSAYEDANEFTSVVISDNATYKYYKGDEEVDENGNSVSNGSSSKIGVSSASKLSATNKNTITEKSIEDMAKSLLEK